MMPIRVVRLVAVLGVLIVVGTSCSSDDDDSTSAQSEQAGATDEAGFIDGFCAAVVEVNGAEQELLTDIGSARGDGDFGAVADAAEQLQQVADEQAQALDDLNPPGDLEEARDQLRDSYEDLSDHYGDMVSAAEDEDAAEIERIGDERGDLALPDAAIQLSLDECRNQ